jgi:hypothetical protein
LISAWKAQLQINKKIEEKGNKFSYLFLNNFKMLAFLEGPRRNG